MKNRFRKSKPADIPTNPFHEIPLSAEDRSELEQGIRLFNSGKFWHAHEAWELVWQRIPDDERLFFHGLIQLAAAYHHMAQGRNSNGFVNNLRKAGEKLRVFVPRYLGIEVETLLAAIEAGIGAAGTDGGDGLADLDRSLIPRISYHLHYHPDLLAAIRTVTETPEFVEGVNLFNRGYYWEAHEMWQEAGRRSEVDGNTFLEGFIQAAGGINLLKSAKNETAGYLLSKSLENLAKFDEIRSGIDFQDLLAWISDHLVENGTGRFIVMKTGTPVPSIRMNGHESPPDGKRRATS